MAEDSEPTEERDIGEEVIEGLQEVLQWTEGQTKTKVTQWHCGDCGKDVKLEDEVYNHQLPLVCDECSQKTDDQ